MAAAAPIPNQPPQPAGVVSSYDLSQGKPNGYQWLLAWTVLIALVFLLLKTTWGRVLVYYVLLLMIVLVVLSNYRFIQEALSPFKSLTHNQGGSNPKASVTAFSRAKATAATTAAGAAAFGQGIGAALSNAGAALTSGGSEPGSAVQDSSTGAQSNGATFQYGVH